MKTRIKLLFIASSFLFSLPTLAEIPTGWQQITHGGLSFAIPGEWTNIKERKFEGQWGLKDDEKREVVIFSIARERHPERALKSATKDGLEVTELARVDLGALTGEQYEVKGNSKELGEVFMRVTFLDGLLPDGDRITYSASAVNQQADDVSDVIARVMQSVQPTDELVATLTGYSRHELFDGLLSVEVRNNWEKSDYSDHVTWEPPLVSLYGGDLIEFAKGYHLTGSKGLLNKIENPTVEKIEVLGHPGWKISGTGVAVSYRDAMHSNPVPAKTEVYLSNICIAGGDRFGYVITASAEQLTEQQDELDKLLTSVRLTLPEGASACDELLEYESKRAIQVKVPKSWRLNQDDKFHISWYDRDIPTGADINLYISHGTTSVHPIKGEGYAPADTIETLAIDSYPATHYRKTVTGSDKIAAIYDYYVLDTRMTYKAQGQISDTVFVYFQFSTRPAEKADPDTEMQHGILSSAVFGPGWETETPVVRETRSGDQAPIEEKDAAVSTGVLVTEPLPEKSGADPAPQQQATVEESTESQPQEPKAEVVIQKEPEEESDKRALYEEAKLLRESGAELQQQGDLKSAVQKYRESLSLYPDDRLEAHVRQIEEILSGQQ